MENKKEIVHIPNCELELMLIIWEAGRPVSRKDIEEKIEGKNWGPTTFLKFLSRLTEKGFLSCEAAASGRRNLYTPLISEEEYLAFESSSVMGKFCGRSVKALVANLYENNAIDEEGLDELQKFITDVKKSR